MKKLFCLTVFSAASLFVSHGQVLLSSGLTYSQNFDTLPVGANNSTPGWTDNTTMLGWYSSRAFTAGSTSAYGPYAYTTIRVSAGAETSGWIYSYGVLNDVERALGSVSSGTPKTNVFGLRIQNDTAGVVDTVTVSYTGEQWRNGGNTAAQKLDFSYQVGSSFAGPIGVGSAPADGWVGVAALNFISPTVGASSAALDGNLAANQTVFSNIVLPGVALNPGEEIFLRWLDIDDSGSDHGLAIDNFSVSFSAVVPEPATATLLGLGALGLILRGRRQS